nr:hypothetical protein [Tanacetum cinerariifolium]
VETMVVFIGGDEAAMVGLRWVAVAAEEWRRRVVESGVVDLVDRETGNVFGVRRKLSPEKFFDGGGPRWSAGGRRWLPKMWERGECVL